MNNKQRLKNVLNIYSGGTPQESDIYLTENEFSISWITPSDFSTGSDILKSSRFIKNGCQKSILLPKNSLIMSCRAPVGKIGYIKNNGMAFNQGCKGFIPKKNQNSKYWFFVLLSLKNEFDKFSKGTTFKEINTKNVKNIIVRKETIQNQNLIANFLEKISSNININIEKKSKKIQLLKEYKEALIYETVTKGFDKKSNILWKAKRLKDIIYLNKGKAVETVLEQINGYLPLIDTNYLRNRKDNIVYSKNGLYVKKNEILVLWDGANSGEMFYNTNNGFLGSTFGVMKLKSKVNNSKFLFYYLKAFEKDIRKDIVGMGIPHVNGTKLKQRLIYIPPNNEQNEIVNFLDKKTKEIDSEVKKLYKKIELIKELKESIIYECVTGKLDIEKEGEKYQKIIESI